MTRQPFDDDASAVSLARVVAARRIALAPHRGRHHAIGCTGRQAILATMTAQHRLAAHQRSTQPSRPERTRP